MKIDFSRIFFASMQMSRKAWREAEMNSGLSGSVKIFQLTASFFFLYDVSVSGLCGLIVFFLLASSVQNPKNRN